MSTFHIYSIGPIYRLGLIYAVIACFKKDNYEKIITEWYYFVRDKDSKTNKSINSILYGEPEKILLDLQENLKNGIYYNEIVPLLDQIDDAGKSEKP
jgi:hypothetical protein